MRKKKINLFEFIFESNGEYEDFKKLGFVPGQHPVITTKNKFFGKLKENIKLILSGQNKYLPNYNKKLTPEELLRLVTKGKIDYESASHTEETEIDISQAVDKPGLLIDVLKELVNSGHFTKSEATPALKYLLTHLARIKLAVAQKEKGLSKISDTEVDRSVNQFFNKVNK